MQRKPEKTPMTSHTFEVQVPAIKYVVELDGNTLRVERDGERIASLQIADPCA
jgi:hypothetical protein